MEFSPLRRSLLTLGILLLAGSAFAQQGVIPLGSSAGPGVIDPSIPQSTPWTFGQVFGAASTQAGTTYSFAATDCGTTVIFTSGSSVTATIPAAIVPALNKTCVIAVVQSGAGKVSVNGTAVSAATLVSAHSYTGTSGTAGSVIDLLLTTVGATTTAYLLGDGS